MGGGGCSKQLKISPGGGFWRGVKFLIYKKKKLGGGVGQPGNPSALAAPLGVQTPPPFGPQCRIFNIVPKV